jgi:hypothetical protein
MAGADTQCSIRFVEEKLVLGIQVFCSNAAAYASIRYEVKQKTCALDMFCSRKEILH